MTTAQDIMTSNPVCCQASDTIKDAVQIMKNNDCGLVPIVDQDDHCIGVVTDRDICLQVVLNQLDAQATPMSEVMNRDLVTCRQNDDIEQVLTKMERAQIRRIPVIDDQEACVGIIAQADIAIRNHEQNAGELVGAVSR